MSDRPDATWAVGLRLCVLETADYAFWTHRAHLGCAALHAGMEVHVIAPGGDKKRRIRDGGFRYHELRHLDRSGTNPVAEARAIHELIGLFRAIRPDVVHNVALKAVLNGSIAARAVGIKAIVGSVTGLGYAFIPGGAKRTVLREALCLALRAALRASDVHSIFQNPDDQAMFTRRGIVSPWRTTLVAGSGVDTDRFRPVAEEAGTPVILVGTRMLWDKGIGELVDAARQLRARGVPFELRLAGVPDESNPATVHASQLRAWEGEGLVRWLGHVDDMAAALAAAHIACLPSYREGLPLFLAEAAAAGRPAVTTDVPGCREVVKHEQTGLLVQPKTVAELAGALERLLTDPALRSRLGAAARQRAERHFSHRRVIEQTFDIYRSLLRPPN